MLRADSFFYSGQRQAFLRINQQSVHAAAIGAQNLKTQAFDVDDFIAFGQASEVVDDQAADRIEVSTQIGPAIRQNRDRSDLAGSGRKSQREER